jgi:D-beta-D-heptose 7-phosphate kinase/D-beta-D-heptose 1-phosphate adenosyltransferase
MTIVAISGGFDPVHIGHVRMIKAAKKLGDRLLVIVNNDNWLKKKKGFVFMPENERIEIIEAFEDVDYVMLTDHEPNDSDNSVCSSLTKYNVDIFANGGDRKSENIPEYKLCEIAGITMVFNVGGEKIQSSSELVKKCEVR